MKFFGRHNEIKELQETRNLSLQTARFTIVTGRRRSGKTSLLIKAYEDVQDMLYFFVARKSEAELCRDFIEEMTSKLQFPILGEVTRFADIFKYLLQLSKTRPITLVIDEFQDFKRVNPSIFSDMQKGLPLAVLLIVFSIFFVRNIFRNILQTAIKNFTQLIECMSRYRHICLQSLHCCMAHPIFDAQRVCSRFLFSHRFPQRTVSNHDRAALPSHTVFKRMPFIATYQVSRQYLSGFPLH